MYRELKENKPHGTKEYPYTQYFIRYTNKAFHIPVHWHDELEIIYVKKGRLMICIQEEWFEGTKGQLFFVNPGELHFMESEDVLVEYYTILFPMEFISFWSEDIIEQKKRRLPVSIVNPEIEEMVRTLIEELIDTNNEKEFGYTLHTRILLLQIMEQFLAGKLFLPVTTGNSVTLQREMISYIQEHYDEKITLQMLAEEFHLSEKYISEYFKEHFAIGFMQYVGHLRMTKAKHLLLNTDLSIMDVALSCGFNSVNLFIRKFKELYQMTPLQYRKFDKVI